MHITKFIFIVLFSAYICACSSANWLDKHGIDENDLYSDESIVRLVDIMRSGNDTEKDWIIAAKVLSNMHNRNDRVADSFYQLSKNTNKYSFLMSASVYFINNRYIDYAIYTLGKLLTLPRYRVQVWAARKAAPLGRDATPLLPILKNIARPGYAPRKVQKQIRFTINAIENASLVYGDQN